MFYKHFVNCRENSRRGMPVCKTPQTDFMRFRSLSKRPPQVPADGREGSARHIGFEHVVVIVPVNVSRAHDRTPGQFGMTGAKLAGKASRGFGDDFERARDGIKGLAIGLEGFEGDAR